MITIKEIAELSKVSPSTVSRILNHDPSLSVSNETKLRVLEVADENDYIPVKKRKLKTEKNSRLNVAIFDWYVTASLLEDPYYLYLMTTFEKNFALENINYFKIFKVDENYIVSVDKKIDAIIAIGRFSDEDVEGLSNICSNIIFVDSSPDASKYDSILINTACGTTSALKYLVELGHENIGYLGGTVVNDTGTDIVLPVEDSRKVAFINYLKKINKFNGNYIFEGKRLSFEEGSSQVKKMIESKNIPTALFVANDSMAIGAISKLKEFGYSVPNDISVIGFNDLPMDKLLDPPLTSVRIEMNAIAETVVNLLKNKKRSNKRLPLKIYIPTYLVIRKTCSIPKK